MDYNAIAVASAAAATFGVGAGLGLRLCPSAFRAWREARDLDRRSQKPTSAGALPRPSSTLRASSIVGLYRDALRHEDGSYTRAYHVGLRPTVLADDTVIERRSDDLARLLSARKPVGAVIQFRLATDVDFGEALVRHESARDRDGVHASALALHESGLLLYAELAARGAFRRQALTCWVRVPSGGGRVEGLLPVLAREARAHGPLGFLGAASRAWRPSSGRAIQLRSAREEEAAFAEAEKTFRLVEGERALEFTRFTADELWAAVYYGHRQSAASAPATPPEGIDAREYLCGETIAAAGDFLLHGATPVAIVSLFTPPQPFVTADALRLLSANGSLNFRHTVVSEFVYPDQAKAVRRLDRRMGQVSRSAQSISGRRRFSFEAASSLDDLAAVRRDITGGREALARVRFYAVVYGEPTYSRAEREGSARELAHCCERLVAEIRRIDGADADREEPAALRALYPRTLLGEAGPSSTYREITETASALAPLIPTESDWEGAARPHTLFSTPTGKLLGLDLYDRARVPSPLALALAAPRGGKSVLLGRLACDVLATKRGARVRALDFGESFAPLVDVLGGRHLRFDPGSDRTINVWDYEGLGRGEMPDEVQVSFVVGDLMELARAPARDVLAEDIFTTLVGEIYRNEAPRNRPGLPRHEPRLAHIVDLLATWPFGGAAVARAAELKLALAQFVGHSFLDAPTHPDFARDSCLDVYELDSLESFPARVRESLAYRAAARLLGEVGRTAGDGTRPPQLLVFDEVWRIREKYPRILDVIRRGARTGGKENVVTVLSTQAYEDLADLPDVAKTAGVKFVGKQLGDYSRLASDAGLSPQAAAAVSVLHNSPGSHAQFLLVLGSGEDQVAQQIQCDLSPAELWTLTTNPDERNARARVRALRPGWTLAEAVAWLAARYPRGLTGAGLVGIDESLLDEVRP